jgi:hypothetical protein
MKAIEVPTKFAARAYTAGLIYPIPEGWQVSELGLRLLREYLDGLEEENEVGSEQG